MSDINRILDKMGTREEELELIRNIRVPFKTKNSEEFKRQQGLIVEKLEEEIKKNKE